MQRVACRSFRSLRSVTVHGPGAGRRVSATAASADMPNPVVFADFTIGGESAGRVEVCSGFFPSLGC